MFIVFIVSIVCSLCDLSLRDMAYIALENDVNVFKCHVFRLDHPAQSFVGVVMSHLKGISSQTVKGTSIHT